ncbi:MAG TPA: outer membrane lipid asymmetry maintenance protein MlaD [Geobacteraceae bacterium]
MKKANLEIVVGIFMLVGILCLGYLSIKLGKMELIGTDTYRLTADFTTVSGLKEGATAELAGVIVGRVSRVMLDPKDPGQARVVLKLTKGVQLSEDVIASVRTRGIIGDKFVKLQPGGSEKYLTDGGRIRNTESAIDFEELISQYIQGKI